MMNPGSRLDSTLTTATLSVNVGGVHVTLFCSELVRSVMLEGQFCTVGGVTSKEKKHRNTALDQGGAIIEFSSLKASVNKNFICDREAN